MRRPSQRTIDAAVFVCRVMSSHGGDHGPWPWKYAREVLGYDPRDSVANLADIAERTVYNEIGGHWRATYAHAADLLESGWLPGDPLVRL